MDWLYKISITCFAASYTVVFLLEVSRVFFKASYRQLIAIGFAAAGLFAHTIYLVYQNQLHVGSEGIWLGNWFGWCLGTAWVLAAAYLWVSIRQPKSLIGLFVLPVVMILIFVGIQLGNDSQFTVNRARTVWRTIHGISLLLGTAVVALGFIFGMVYLFQARRLKQKISHGRFRLPSLEWLQSSSERSLIGSACLLGVGLLSGIAINQIQEGESAKRIFEWSNPVVWSSAILFAWLLIATLFNLLYQPARQGRKVAYLVVASFLFLVLELGIVWWAGHATVSTSGTLQHSRLQEGWSLSVTSRPSQNSFVELAKGRVAARDGSVGNAKTAGAREPIDSTRMEDRL